MNRLEKLQKMLAADPNDPFLRYGVALEYKSLGDPRQAIQSLEQLQTDSPDYVPTYYILAELYSAIGEREKAILTARLGIDYAIKSGDVHAASELRAALEEFEDE